MPRFALGVAAAAAAFALTVRRRVDLIRRTPDGLQSRRNQERVRSRPEQLC
jgi:hypothetical protein